jgi:hypothetical protein
MLCGSWRWAVSRRLAPLQTARARGLHSSPAFRHPTASHVRAFLNVRNHVWRSYGCDAKQIASLRADAPCGYGRHTFRECVASISNRGLSRSSDRGQDGSSETSQVFLRPEAPATVPLPAIELSATPRKPRLLHLQKADTAASLGLMVRDMRAVDASFRNSAPTIVSRRTGIIMHLEHVRVVITTDRVLVFDPGNPDVEAFIPRLQSRLISTSHPMPFELRAVEGVLIDVCASLNAQLGTLTPAIDLVLDTLSTTTDFGGNTVQYSLDRLLPLEVRSLSCSNN